MKLPSRYVPKSKKSGGGMSRVTLCRDSQLERDVIIKALALGVDEGRLLDEIKALQSIRSGYVVQIYDVIDDDGDIVAVVEEYCAGSDLSDWAGDIDNDDFHRFGYELAAGIAEIHACGVIHRDIKPPNVRVSDSGDLTIIDFGLARQTGEDAKTISDIGTAGFMAPELFKLNRKGEIEFTEAIDVFAFASSMFMLVEGNLPIDVRRRPPKLPCPELDFGDLDIDLSPRLVRTLNACFEENPAKRPLAGELADEFRRVLLHDRHRALINLLGTANYLDSSNRKVTASISRLATVTIEYNGDDFVATEVNGDIYVNNTKIAVGYVFPGSCVIAFGGPALQNLRVYVTFDVSHPGVEV
jgi:eukaryotic-like serine/threonine-protein kinase